MLSLSAVHLLEVWEQGSRLPPYRQALLLLEAAFPDLHQDVLARWSLGQRDSALLDLHEQAFGPDIEALANCPQCATPTTVQFQTADIRAAYAPPELPPLTITQDGQVFVIRLRPVSTAALHQAQVGQAELVLFDCIVSASRAGELLAATDLPVAVLERCRMVLAEADPQADIQLALRCLECGQRWNAAFDPISFVWREIDQWAERTLHEIHVLATAYGWHETTILALSASRRRRYIEMVMA